jgi:chemotaxis protein MotA
MILTADSLPDLVAFVNWSGVMITVGGAVAATMISVKINVFIAAMKAIKIAFKPPTLNPTEGIEKIVALANTARKEGVLALEESAETMDDKFLKKGIMLIVDGTDPELVKSIMETELLYIEERHADISMTYSVIGDYSPAWGMAGTLVGLILMLLTLDDPSTIGPKMSIAVVTTFYGTLMANLWAIPTGTKLKQISKDEVLLKTVLIEGMLSIQAGENPRIIEEKLKSFLSPSIRENVGTGGGAKAGAGEAAE